MRDSVLSIARHALTFGGGFLVSAGWVDSSDLQAGIGALVTLAGIVWGVVEKRSR